jgi:hypothetical protein
VVSPRRRDVDNQLAHLYGEFALRIAGVSNVSAARIG